MPIPASITAITVSNSYLGADGSPLPGTVTFTPSATTATEGVTLPVAPTIVTLDANGAFSVDLMATDDADWAPDGFTYTVKEQIRGTGAQGTYTRTYNIEVPAASPNGELDLALAAPVENPTLPPNYASTESIGYVFEAPAGAVSRVVMRAPKALAVTAVRGYRVGGTGATINAQNAGSDLLSSDLSLSSSASWAAGSGLQNTSVASGSTITLELASISGSPSYVTVEVDYQAVI